MSAEPNIVDIVREVQRLAEEWPTRRNETASVPPDTLFRRVFLNLGLAYPEEVDRHERTMGGYLRDYYSLPYPNVFIAWIDNVSTNTDFQCMWGMAVRDADATYFDGGG